MQERLKVKSLAIDPVLHRYLKLLSALDSKQINELTEPELWKLVGANRARLEKVTGEPVVLPEEVAA